MLIPFKNLAFSAASAVLLVTVAGCQRSEPAAPLSSAPVEKVAAASEAPKCTDCNPVTVENFPRAETDLYFKQVVEQQAKSIGSLYHFREPLPIDKQAVVRGNRDTLIQQQCLISTAPQSPSRFRTQANDS
jgi:hypothetical protein